MRGVVSVSDQAWVCVVFASVCVWSLGLFGVHTYTIVVELVNHCTHISLSKCTKEEV